MICPNCGAVVHDGALSCRECGSDRSTGWSKAAEYAHLLPDEDGLPAAPAKPTRSHHLVWLVLLLGLTAVLWSRLRWAALVIPLLAIGFVFFKHRSGAGSERGLFAELVVRCQNDRELAERLIAAELQRHPRDSRAQLIRRAIERLSHHRR